MCGGMLRAVTKRGRHGRPLDLYVCDDKGCVGRSEPAVDQLVEKIVIGRLAMPDASTGCSATTRRLGSGLIAWTNSVDG